MSSSGDSNDDTRRIVAQWQSTGRVLERLRIEALIHQSDTESREAAADMLDFASQLPEDRRRISTSGLVEMQELLAALRNRDRD